TEPYIATSSSELDSRPFYLDAVPVADRPAEEVDQLRIRAALLHNFDRRAVDVVILVLRVFLLKLVNEELQLLFTDRSQVSAGVLVSKRDHATITACWSRPCRPHPWPVNYPSPSAERLG